VQRCFVSAPDNFRKIGLPDVCCSVIHFSDNGIIQDLAKFKRSIRSSKVPRLFSLPPANKLGSRLTCFHHHPSPSNYKFTVSSDSWGWVCSELWALASAAQIPASD